MMRTIIHFAIWLAIAALLAWKLTGTGRELRAPDFPAKPIEIVVPFAAGGGSDTFARLLEREINRSNLLSQPVFITNIPGGSGTIGSRVVKDAKPDGYRILCLHEGILTSKQTGTVAFGPEAFEAIAQTGTIAEVVVVRQDSRWQDLHACLTEAKEQPGSVRFGTNIGAPAHFAGLHLERDFSGAQFQFMQSGGGQKRYQLLIGGHIDVAVFSLAEFVNYRGEANASPDQQLRALAVFSEQRHPALPETPSVNEFGIQSASGNAQYWWAPRGTAPDRVKLLSAALRSALESEEVRVQLKKQLIEPVFRDGQDLFDYLQQREIAVQSLTVSSRQSLPDFALGSLICSFVLCILSVVTYVRRPVQPKPEATKHTDSRPRSAAIISRSGTLIGALVLVSYVVLFQLRLLPFWVLTACFLMALGRVLFPKRHSKWSSLVQYGLFTALSFEILFRHILHVQLP